MRIVDDLTESEKVANALAEVARKMQSWPMTAHVKHQINNIEREHHSEKRLQQKILQNTYHYLLATEEERVGIATPPTHAPPDAGLTRNIDAKATMTLQVRRGGVMSVAQPSQSGRHMILEQHRLDRVWNACERLVCIKFNL